MWQNVKMSEMRLINRYLQKLIGYILVLTNANTSYPEYMYIHA